MPAFVYILIVLVLALIIWFLVSLGWGKPWNINLFYARVFLKLVLDSPELLTMLGILEKMGIHWHNARLSDASMYWIGSWKIRHAASHSASIVIR
jgi:hypothetical protein